MRLTCVDEILVGEAGVVNVMDSAGEYGGESLKGREHRLDTGVMIIMRVIINKGAHLEGRGAQQSVH